MTLDLRPEIADALAALASARCVFRLPSAADDHALPSAPHSVVWSAALTIAVRAHPSESSVSRRPGW